MKKQTKTRRWTQKQRAERAAQMRKTKPWLTTRGPKTPAGKNIVKTNALKHGHYTGDWLLLQDALAAHRRFLACVCRALRELAREIEAENGKNLVSSPQDDR